MQGLAQLIALIVLGVIALAIIARLGVLGDKTRADKIAHGRRQRAAVDKTAYLARALFNASERKTFAMLREAIRMKKAPLFVMAQTSMGAMLRTLSQNVDDREGFDAINSKRVDFALVDESGQVRLVIEFDGPSHGARDAAIRDEIKSEALRKAGIKLLRIDYQLSDAQQRAAISRAIDEIET